MTFTEAVRAIVKPGVIMRRVQEEKYQNSFSMLEGTLALDNPKVPPWDFSLPIADILADDWIVIQKEWIEGKGWVITEVDEGEVGWWEREK